MVSVNVDVDVDLEDVLENASEDEIISALLGLGGDSTTRIINKLANENNIDIKTGRTVEELVDEIRKNNIQEIEIILCDMFPDEKINIIFGLRN